MGVLRRGVEMTEGQEFARQARAGAVRGQINGMLLWVVLLGGSLLLMIPFYVMIAMSLKTPEEISNSSMWAWPHRATLANYRILLTDPELNFGRKFLNTLFLSVVPTFGVVTTAAIVAYPFARLRFAGRDRLFLILLATMMLPGVVTMIPGYVLYAKLGWIDTYKPFVIPAFFGGGAFNIFLLRQFMMGIPREMDEAARLDGASNATIFWRVLLPNCGPVLATIAVFCFVGSFRDFIGPLMMLNDPDKMTLEVGLRSLQTEHQTDFHLMMAGAMLVMAPIVIIFLLCQRYFVRGIALTGGK
ncbi:carbohydrate ABC transporter permease [bacterium]|nr:MAG: carbohydrate ABC transporter permease [bacterium]